VSVVLRVNDGQQEVGRFEGSADEAGVVNAVLALPSGLSGDGNWR